MARLEDLLGRIEDDALRREIAAEVSKVKRKAPFGLVFERHLPETVTLHSVAPSVGAQVRVRTEPGINTTYKVIEIENGKAEIANLITDERRRVETAHLHVVKDFGEPVYPALTPLGRVECGGDRPFHSVIEGENFHVLQMLAYLYRNAVDVIYIDPPYNTGARDWRYNNNYVDENDRWRHSKWLSFMDKRLRLAKRLLKPDGVLIVTIDEHEVHHLGMLLESLFPEARRQLVTIVINPLGQTRRHELGRVEEYALFNFFGNSAPCSGEDDLLNSQGKDTQKLRWEWLLRGGTEASRRDRPNMFYPVYIDPSSRIVVDVGQPLAADASRLDVRVPHGTVAVWPLRTSGEEGRWRLSVARLRALLEQGHARVGQYDRANDRWSLLYLGNAMIRRIEEGEIAVTGRHEATRAVQLSRVGDEVSAVAKTVWSRGSHRSGENGTRLLAEFLGERRFPFPKSLYAVKDALRVACGDRPDALVVDFFAGSGTTLHATGLLNVEDGGQRRCVLVTNNEVDAETRERLQERGVYPGDPEYEGQGIFQHVTRPRCEAAVTGRRPDGAAVPGVYLGGRERSVGLAENVEFYRLDYLDPDTVALGEQYEAILPALWLMSGGQGARESHAGEAWSMPEGGRYAVLFEEARLFPFAVALAERPDIQRVFLVTDSEESYAQMREALGAQRPTSMLYRDYLRNFRINTARNL